MQPRAAAARQGARARARGGERCSLSRKRTPRGARRDDLHRHGRERDRRAADEVCAGALLQIARGDGGDFPRASGGDREHAGDRGAVQSRDRIRQAEISELHAARGLHAECVSSQDRGGRLARALRRAGHGRPRDQGAHRARAGRARDAGVRELLPHRLGFHRLGEEAGHPGGAGPRLGGRLDGGVRDGHHGHRSRRTSTWTFA